MRYQLAMLSTHERDRLRHHLTLPGGPWSLLHVKQALAKEGIAISKVTIDKWATRWGIAILQGAQPGTHKGRKPGAKDLEPRKPHKDSLRFAVEQLYAETVRIGKPMTIAEMARLIGGVTQEGVRYHLLQIQGVPRKPSQRKKDA